MRPRITLRNEFLKLYPVTKKLGIFLVYGPHCGAQGVLFLAKSRVDIVGTNEFTHAIKIG